MKTQAITLVLSFVVSGTAMAAGAPVGNQFSSGQPARAADVNENFQELADRIDSSAPTVGYSVNENLTSRTFADITPASAGACDQRVDTFAFNAGANTFEQNVVIGNSSDTSVCEEYDFSWNYATDLLNTGYSISVSNGSNVNWVFGLSSGWLYLKAQMRVGESWASHNDRTISIDGGASTSILPEYYKMTLAGYKDISVTAGDFQNCLMIDAIRWSSGSSEHRIYFYCDGPGLTRYINLTNGNDWQLQSYSTALD